MSNDSAKRVHNLKSKKVFTINELAEIMNGDDSDFIFEDDDDLKIDDISTPNSTNEIPIESTNDFPDINLVDVEYLGPSTRKASIDVPSDSESETEQELPYEYVVLATEANPVIDKNVQFEFISEANTDSRLFTEKSNIQWRRGNKPFEPNEIPFVPLGNSDENLELTPLQIFEKHLTIEFFEKTSFFTNLYAEQNNVRSFKQTNTDEIRKLFGLHMLMGNLGLRRTRLYWNANIQIASVINCMTNDRFHQLRNNLHFVNNLECANNSNDKFYKVRPMVDIVRNRCLQHPLEENLSIDEQMIPFKGKLHVKQYVKGKPYPWGLKNFVLSGKSGLPYDFFLYQGKTTEISEVDSKKFGFGAAVVLHLSKRITSSGHKLYFDNYFSTYQLLEILKHNNINAIGTIRVNRFKNPPLLDIKERGASDEVHSRDEKVVVVKWQDNKSVHVASNFIGIGNEGEVRRWDKSMKKYISIKQPQIIKMYNTNMGGVDFMDQLISYYRIFMKSKKWTLRVVTHFIDFAVCASWIEYRNYQKQAGIPNKNIPDLFDFRLQVAHILMVSSTLSTRKRGRPTLSELNDSTSSDNTSKKRRFEVRPVRDMQYDQMDHFPDHNQKILPMRCKFPNCTSKSHFYCTKCKVHLCLNKERNCFLKFHKK